MRQPLSGCVNTCQALSVTEGMVSSPRFKCIGNPEPGQGNWRSTIFANSASRNRPGTRVASTKLPPETCLLCNTKIISAC